MSESLIGQLDEAALPGKDSNRIIVREHEGYMIYVGQNAQSNEKIVKDHPHKSCIWLHALGSRGSHVVLCHSKIHDTFSDAAIRKAAELALRFSRSKGKSVMFSRLEFVIKPANGATGVFHPMKTTQLDLE